MLLMAACFVLARSASAADGAPVRSESVPVRVALQWLPQSQFAGFYMARDRGFYEDAGLDVALLHTGPGPSSLDFLADGRADYATLFLADAIVNASKPVPLAHLTQFVRRSNLVLIGWKRDGIEKPADLDGRRVSCWPGAFYAAFAAFFNQHDIRPVVLPQNYSVNLFLRGGVDACAAMIYNECHRIYQAGIDNEKLTIFMMRDYDLGFPEDGLYTTTQRAAEKPDECRALARATLAGWEYARRFPEEAIEAVLRESRAGEVPANRTHARWMLEHILASIFPPDDDGAPGRLEPETYLRTAGILKDAGLIVDAPPFENFAPIAREAP